MSHDSKWAKDMKDHTPISHSGNMSESTTNRTTIEIITIGNELLYGLTQDTNTHWLGIQLSEAGFDIVHKTTVGDHRTTLIEAIHNALQRTDIIVTTGGLGPTSDDITKACMATVFNCETALHEEALHDVKRILHHRKGALTEAHRQQAFLPACCKKITNTLGTAPGMWFNKNRKIVVAMPGVPDEMKRMTREEIIPRLKKIYGKHTLQHYNVHTVGIGEASLAGKISTWEQTLPQHIRLAYLPSTGEVTLRLTGRGSDKKVVRAALKTCGDKLHSLVGEYIYGYDGDSLESVVGNKLREHGIKIALAESCTGGYISHRITSIPESSAYYMGGLIAYNNTVKANQLDIPRDMLEQEGAVSQAVVTAMATSVRSYFNVDIGVAVSGIAGPAGATPDKPVGTIWLALCNRTATSSKKLNLTADRITNIRLTSTAALNMIRKNLIGI